MIKIEFVHYITGASYAPTSALRSVNIDSQSIPGIDYHSIESRKAKYSFYTDDDSFLMIFLTTWVNIPNTEYNVLTIIAKKDGVTEHVGYIKPTGVKYDVKTGMMTISCTDILGVLLDISNVDHDYDNGLYSVNTLLQTEITDVLAAYDVSYTDTSDNVSFEVTDSEMTFDNQGEFEEVAGYGVTGNSIVGWDARIRDVQYINGYFRVIICDYHQHYYHLAMLYTEQIKYVFLTFKEDLIFVSNHYDSRMTGTNTPFWLWNNWASGDYGSTGNNTSANNGIDDSVSFGSGTNGARFYFTGTINIENIEIDSGDGEATYITQNRKSMIKMLLILLNAGMRIEKDGDIYIEDKDLIDEANAIDVDSYTLENTKGFILHSEKDFSFSFMKNLRNVSTAIKNYYDTLFESFRYEYTLKISSLVSLSLGNTIKTDGKYMRIVDIDEPYNQNIYLIKAWGE